MVDRKLNDDLLDNVSGGRIPLLDATPAVQEGLSKLMSFENPVEKLRQLTPAQFKELFGEIAPAQKGALMAALEEKLHITIDPKVFGPFFD